MNGIVIMANWSSDGETHGLPAERSTFPRPLFTDSISPSRLFRASKHAAERAPLVAKASLFDLPLEIRLLIYKYLFLDDVDQFPTIINPRRSYQLSEWVKDMDLRFCDVFKGTYHEALPVAFGCSSFRLDGFVRSEECSYRSGKQNCRKDPEDTRIPQSLINQIRTVHVDFKMVGMCQGSRPMASCYFHPWTHTNSYSASALRGTIGSISTHCSRIARSLCRDRCCIASAPPKRPQGSFRMWWLDGPRAPGIGKSFQSTG